MIDVLRDEIEARLHAAHPVVIIAALDSLLAEIKINRHDCSYHAHFMTYRRLNSLATSLNRQFNNWVHDDRLRTYSSNDMDTKISSIYDQMKKIKSERYKSVCRRCMACQTRRKAWPYYAVFSSPRAITEAL